MSFPILIVSLVCVAFFGYELARSMVLVRQCAWCHKFMGVKLRGSCARGSASHTICQKCVHKVVSQ